jgi:hypothetical protein
MSICRGFYSKGSGTMTRKSVAFQGKSFGQVRLTIGLRCDELGQRKHAGIS